MDAVDNYRKENTILVTPDEMKQQIMNKTVGGKGEYNSEGQLEYKDKDYDKKLSDANNVLDGRKASGGFYKKGESAPEVSESPTREERSNDKAARADEINAIIRRQDRRKAFLTKLGQNNVGQDPIKRAKNILSWRRLRKKRLAKANQLSQQIIQG